MLAGHLLGNLCEERVCAATLMLHAALYQLSQESELKLVRGFAPGSGEIFLTVFVESCD